VTTTDFGRQDRESDVTSVAQEPGQLSSVDITYIRKRVEWLHHLSTDLLDEIDERLRASLGVDKQASDNVVSDQARMQVANYRTKGGE
jgi:hypothetical protein